MHIHLSLASSNLVYSTLHSDSHRATPTLPHFSFRSLSPLHPSASFGQLAD